MGDTEPKKVVIFGASAPNPGDKEYEEAYEIGKLLGSMGFTVVNGGMYGLMEATAKGAQEVNAKTIGVVPITLKYAPPNKYLNEVIKAKDMYDRIKIQQELGDIFIILKGSTGTLAEFIMVWDHMVLKLIEKKPIICFGDHWKQIVDSMPQKRPDLPKIDIPFIHSIEELKQFLSNHQK